LFDSGRIVDFVLALTALEGLLLVAYYRSTGRGIAPIDLLCNLASGIWLLLAFRLAVAGFWWGWIGACLAAAGLAHFLDLRRRWQR
jgi:hypothetical protein